MSRWLVSVKGVLIRDGRVVLVRNERDEWELPGGQLEVGESPEECVAREVAEELGLTVRADRIVDSWVYEVLPDARVLIVTYGCCETSRDEIVLGPDHPESRWFAVSDLASIPLPDGYRRSIQAWARRLRESAAV